MRKHDQARAVGIVLAGGGSTRLGHAARATGGGKALLMFRGHTFLEHVLLALVTEVHKLIVVAAPGQSLPPLGAAELVCDATPGAGPLAGLRDGLLAASAAADNHGLPAPDFAVVASCDLPLLRREVVGYLLDCARESGAVWTVPLVRGHRQVLVSVLRFDMLPRIETWLATGRRDLRGLLGHVTEKTPLAVRIVSESELTAIDPRLVSFEDIDTPAELERLQSE